ncbi:Fc.00g082200.m01.CDS01 [Cosmosporella sp. VM-42]
MLSRELLDSKATVGGLAAEIAKAECAQLRWLDIIVSRTRDHRAWHGLVLAVSPALATVATAWVQHRVENARVVKIASNDKGGAGRRSQTVAELVDLSQTSPNDPIIVVSTFELMSTGIDGLQKFMTYIVKLGEPWTHAETEQAKGRIHRPRAEDRCGHVHHSWQQDWAQRRFIQQEREEGTRT